MSVLQVHVGQAGVQIGSVCAKITGPPKSDGNGIVFVDSEPKVVAPLLKSGASRLPFLKPSSVVSDVNGRGNNWAWGYTNASSRLGITDGVSGGLRSGKTSLLDRALNVISTHAESMSSVDTILVTHSIGGGTGSGLGSRLLECIRDLYPSSVLIDAVVSPFQSGDTPLQHYNSILSLSHSATNCDAVIFCDNDDILKRARYLSAQAQHYNPNRISTGFAAAGVGGNTSVQVGTGDLNGVIARALASVVMPVSTFDNPWEMRSASQLSPQQRKLHQHDWVDISEDIEKDNAFSGIPDYLNKGNDAIDQMGSDISHSDFGKSLLDTESKNNSEELSYASCTPSGKERKKRSDLRNMKEVKVEDNDFSSEALRRLSSFPMLSSGLLDALDVQGYQKILDIRSAHAEDISYLFSPGVIPQNSAVFGALCDLLCEQYPRYDALGRPIRARAAHLLVRGCSEDELLMASRSSRSSNTSSFSSSSRVVSPSTASGRRIARLQSAPCWEGMPYSVEWSESHASKIYSKSPSGTSESPKGEPMLVNEHWLEIGSKLHRLVCSGSDKSSHGISSGLLRKSSRTASGGSDNTTSSQYTRTSSVFSTALDPKKFNSASLPKHQQSMTIIANSDAFAAPVIRTLTRADELIKARAYIHWYERYGVGVSEIEDAMGHLLEIVEAYRS